MPTCSACGAELGPPQEDVHDPDNGIENPDAHLEAVSGSKGKRFKCTVQGQFAKPVTDDDATDESTKSNGTGRQNETEKSPDPAPDPSPDPDPSPSPDSSGEVGPSPSRQGGGEVYDIDEDKSALDVLIETVQNPTYGFNQDQVAELKDWAEIYDSHIPPSDFEKIINNFSGISKQKAQLVRQKYEAKINRWVREQYSDEGGPPIGASGINASAGGGGGPGLPSPPGGGSPSRPSSGSSPSPPEPSPPSDDTDDGGGKADEASGGSSVPGSGVAERNASRREHAMERRQRALDTMTEAMAEQAANEMAQRLSKGTGFFEILLKSKAKKDPDWFFQKMEEWDVDILEELMSPSDYLKEDLGGDVEGFDVDGQVDAALEASSMGANEPSTSESDAQQEPDPEPQQNEPAKMKQKKENEGPHWEDDGTQDEDIACEDAIFDDLDEDIEMEVGG